MLCYILSYIYYYAYLLSIIYCCVQFSLLSFVPICPNAPFPNPLKCILPLSLLKRIRLLSLSLTDETSIKPYPIVMGVVNFCILNFGHFPYPLSTPNCFMTCLCPCSKYICPKCDVLCFALYLILSMSKMCPVQMCPVYISLSGLIYITQLIFINPLYHIPLTYPYNTPFCPCLSPFQKKGKCCSHWCDLVGKTIVLPTLSFNIPDKQDVSTWKHTTSTLEADIYQVCWTQPCVILSNQWMSGANGTENDWLGTHSKQ